MFADFDLSTFLIVKNNNNIYPHNQWALKLHLSSSDVMMAGGTIVMSDLQHPLPTEPRRELVIAPRRLIATATYAKSTYSPIRPKSDAARELAKPLPKWSRNPGKQ